MLSAEVKNRIKQFNPWIFNPEKSKEFTDRYIPQKYIIRDPENMPVHAERAFLVIGPRQSGKSTMIWHMIYHYLPDVMFLNMEEPLFRDIQAIDLAELIRTEYPLIKTIFVDEVQHMKEAGLFIKGLVDVKINMPIFVTGSSSYHLRSKTRESLAGRVTRCRLLPFSLRELLNFAAPAGQAVARHLSEEIAQHQLIFGSYPGVYLSDTHDSKIAILNDLVESLILRDVSDMFRIERIDAFRKLISLLALRIGNILNLSELASLCGLNVGTINNYIEIMEESHIVKKVAPFTGGKRREIKGASKVFFIDNGIRNTLLNSFPADLNQTADAGAIFENWAFSELYKNVPFLGTVRYWQSKSKAEVDFVVEYAGKLYAVEAKHTAYKKPELSRSAHSFIEAYRPDRFILLNLTLDHEIDVGGIQVSFCTPYTLANLFREFLGNVEKAKQ
jgi:hypothetical protein